ncbi:unnamed protein product [Blepharisma stoltei]|uniref:Ribosomal protein L32 n=1 Tax=Blepharisma stoltei TaxID=1481888 RepID=A0AAU9JVM4_9CILI|nr:unnamed protein product [Blepharisma stoltei]
MNLQQCCKFTVNFAPIKVTVKFFFFQICMKKQHWKKKIFKKRTWKNNIINFFAHFPMKKQHSTKSMKSLIYNIEKRNR